MKMPTININSIQNNANGNQIRDAFRAINEIVGSEVVTNIGNIMNTRYRHPYRASGRQLRNAFQQVEEFLGIDILNTCKPQNIANGRQLVCAFEMIQNAIDNGFDCSSDLLVGSEGPGLKVGVHTSLYGKITPAENIYGEPIYEFTADSTGKIILSYGVAGNLFPTNGTVAALITVDHIDVTLVWDSGETAYIGQAIEVYDDLINKVDQNVCIVLVDATDIKFLAGSYMRTFNELQLEVAGVGGATVVHGGVWSPDHEGVYHPFKANEPVWEGYRKVENLYINSESFQLWATGGGLTVTPDVHMSPIGDMTADEVVASANSSRLTFNVVGESGKQFTSSVWLRIVSGNLTGTVNFYSLDTGNVPMAITSEWKRFENPFTASSDDDQIRIVNLNTPTEEITLAIWGGQLQDGDSATNYVKTESAPVTKYFADDGTGTLLDFWLKYQKAVTNEIIDSTAVSWTAVDVTVTDLGKSQIFPAQNKSRLAGIYTYNNLNIIFPSATAFSGNEDSFVVIVEADTSASFGLRVRDHTASVDLAYLDIVLATGAKDNITVDADIAHKEIATGIYVIAISVTGDIANRLRLYVLPSAGGGNAASILHYIGFYKNATPEQALNTGPIFTSGTALSTDETVYNWAAANHDDIGNSYEGDFRLSGEDQTLLSMGGVPVLSVVSGQIIFSDGTNICQTPVVSNEPHVIAEFSAAGGMVLDVDGVTDTSAYDGTLGAGDISTQCTLRSLLRHFGGGLHVNLITNGDFAAGETGWILGANIAIADGKAYFDSLNGDLAQVIATDLGPGKTFQLTFDILPGAVFGAGGLAIFLDGDGATVNTGGAQSIEFTSGNTDNTLVFKSITPGDFEGEITNISLRGMLNIKTQTICVNSIGGVSGKEFKINGKLINNCKVCKS